MERFINSVNIACYGKNNWLPINLRVFLGVPQQQLLIEHLLCADSVAGTRDTGENKRMSIPALEEFTCQGCGGATANIHRN